MTSVSLCIPAYRSGRYLPDLFARIRALEPKPSEVVLLDDASPDECAMLINDFATRASPELNVRVLRNASNAGIAAAYNRLAQEASSEWVHILDADDYPVEVDFYSRVVDELQSRRDLVVTAVDSNSTLLRWGVAMFGWIVPQQPPRWLPLLGSFATRAGVIYRRALLLTEPFPDPAFPGSDVLHLLRLRKDHICAFTRDAHVYYRVHPAATSSGARSYQEYRAGLAKFGGMTRASHMIDLKLRMLGQRVERRES